MLTKLKINEIQTDVSAFLSMLGKLVVIDEQSLTYANDIQNKLRLKLKFIDEEVKDALDAAKKSYQAAKSSLDETKILIDKIKFPIQTRMNDLVEEIRRYNMNEREKERLRIILEKENEKLKIAQEAESKGDTQGRDIMLDKASEVAEKVVQTGPKLDQRIFGEKWEAIIVNPLEFYKAVGEGKVPLDFASPNMTKLNDRANKEKDKINIPGVQAVRVR
jgi:hypothetical protein